MAKIRIYHHRETRLAANRTNPIMLTNIANQLADDIEGQSLHHSPAGFLRIPNLLIDSFAQLHADKWIEGIGHHVYQYANALSAPDLSVPGTLINDQNVQKSKSFSGDVSGVIGETLFSIVLEKCYGLNDQHIAHFRAHKRTGVYPDFGIYFTSPQFDTELHRQSIVFPFTFPFPCEVKTITTIDKGIFLPRVHKAIQQTQNYWEQYTQDGASIICIALRNPRENAYDLHLVWSE